MAFRANVLILFFLKVLKKESTLLGLVHPEDVGISVLRNADNCSLVDVTEHVKF